MTAKDVLQNALTSTQRMLNQYVEDLSDADLAVRPVPGANHVAWQIGHLIQSEAGMLRDNLPGAAYPQLPAGFAQRHGKEAAKEEGTEGLASKRDYLALFNQTRQATLAALDRLSDPDLERATTGSMARHAPKLAEMLMLVSNHTLMHVGQFTAVRRKLGKPVLF